ncbi:hypothetical protein LY28_03351 [Ruminiclostridium sufflavum DSM 19573]|uniref:TGF-beta propeptide n=1 Tax=Ruminiclostridium sufflavum DSM 19573 TaxID=1121337 RepID=A0A318XI22_9FIRM|nr:DNRLRE domain-containing protein [Ruminiclostridium sufflavum]PYG84993.1 hypothetical protein LY28_03351 [Ruminiclostridium sufflavum DSM 19573]
MSIITLVQIFDDVYIDSSRPDKNFSKSNVIWVGKKEDDTIQRSLLKCDLSFIPQGSKIISSNLNIYLDYDPSEMELEETITPYAITDSWEVSKVTWNNQPSVSNNIRGAATSLSIEGYYSFVITDFVERWVNRGYPNNGLELKADEVSIDNSKRFVSCDEKLIDKQTFKPVFVIQYEPLPLEEYVLKQQGKANTVSQKAVSTEKSIEQKDADKSQALEAEGDTDTVPEQAAGNNSEEIAEQAIEQDGDTEHEEVTTSDEYQTTAIKDTSEKTHVSFFVNNLTENLAEVGIEVSSDGVNFLRQNYDPIPQGLEIFIPYYYAPYTRLFYKSKTEGQHTVLSIDFVSQA